MAAVTFPPAYDQRVLALEAPGGAPARVTVAIPTMTRPGEPFEARIAVLDELGYPSVECDAVVGLLDAQGTATLAEVPFTAGQPAVGAVTGLALDAEGLCRLAAELDGKAFPSNPTCCRAGASESIYWGDPHVHTVLSQCHADKCRSVDFCYTAGRYVTGLDWVAAADHVSNGRCEFARWKQQALACDAHDDPPAFVTLGGYEASLQGGCGGDTNVYMTEWPQMFVDEHDEGNVRTLCEKLGDVLGPEKFFVVPHHTTRTGKHGEIPDEIYPGEELMPVVEIHSKWGTSEYRGNPNPLKDIHPGPSYVQDFLARGLKLGFIGGTDTHATMPAGGGLEPGHIDRLPGLTAVRCEQLTRRSVFDAIRNRNCYAASGERIYLDARIEQAGTVREVSVTAAARSDIETIEIVRNGEVVDACRPGAWSGTVELTDDVALAGLWLESQYLGRFAYYYVRVTCVGGAQAWSSPVWLTRG